MKEKLETSSNWKPGVLVKSLQRYHGKNEQSPCSPLSQNYRYVCVSFLEKGVFVLLFTQVFRFLSSCPWNHGRTPCAPCDARRNCCSNSSAWNKKAEMAATDQHGQDGMMGWQEIGMLPSGKHTKSYWKWWFSSWIFPLIAWWIFPVCYVNVYQRVRYWRRRQTLVLCFPQCGNKHERCWILRLLGWLSPDTFRLQGLDFHWAWEWSAWWPFSNYYLNRRNTNRTKNLEIYQFFQFLMLRFAFHQFIAHLLHGAGIFSHKTGWFLGDMLGFIFQHHGSHVGRRITDSLQVNGWKAVQSRRTDLKPEKMVSHLVVWVILLCILNIYVYIYIMYIYIYILV